MNRSKKSVMFAFMLLIITAYSALGDVVISEIMQNPSEVNDADGEYIELYNNDPSNTVELEGWTIRDDDGDSHTIAPGVIIPPESYIVLCRNNDSAINGEVTCDYEYSSFTLSNGNDEVILNDTTSPISIEIDRVEYDGGPNFPNPTGASMELMDLSSNNNIGSNWKTASEVFGDGDRGTPGKQTTNDIPVADDDSFDFTEDIPNTNDTIGSDGNIAVLVGDTDDNGDILTAVLDTDVNNGTLNLFLDGSFYYAPDDNFFGTDSFTYHANDGSADSNIATVTLNVAAVNDAPIITSDPFLEIMEDQTFQHQMESTDVDGPSAFWQFITNLAGVIIDSVSGVITWTPNNGDVGQNSTTVEIYDDHPSNNQTDQQVLIFDVTNTNDPPEATDDNVDITNEDTNITTVNVTVNDIDDDFIHGDKLFVQSVDTSSTVGLVTNNNDGTFGYDPNGGFESLNSSDQTQDTFTYTIADNSGAPDTGTVTITITGKNDAPTIDSVSIFEGNIDVTDEGIVTQDVTFFVEITASDVDNNLSDLSVDLDVSTFGGTPLTTLGALQYEDDSLSFEIEVSELELTLGNLYDLILSINDSAPLATTETIELYLQPALDFKEINVNGVANSDEGFIVDLGDLVTVDFHMINNFDDTLEHVGFDAYIVDVEGIDREVHSNFCTGVECDDGSWAMLTGDEKNESFSFTIPLDLIGDSPFTDEFTLELGIFENGEGYETFEQIQFIIDREDHDTKITGLSPVKATLSCSNTAVLDLSLTNTGSETIIPEVLVYSESKDNAVFNKITGEFTSNSSKVHEETLGSIDSSEALNNQTINVDVSTVANGARTLYLYVVHPLFNDGDDYFIADQAQVTINLESCVGEFSPEENSITLGEDEAQTFEITLTEPTDEYISEVKWFLDNEETGTAGSLSHAFTANDIGTFLLRVDTPDESQEWSITVSNVPITTLTTNIPSNATLDELRFFDLIVENSVGKIVFDSVVDLRNIPNLDDLITISDNLVYVNTTQYLRNKPATITLKKSFSNPTIFYDSSYNPNTIISCQQAGVSCVVTSNQNGQLVFKVTSFSTYKVLETTDPNLAVSDVIVDNFAVGDTTTTTIVVSNPGTLQDLTDIKYSFVGVDTKYNAQLTGLPTTLATESSANAVLTLTIPKDESPSKHGIGTLQITAFNGTQTIQRDVDISIEPKTFLVIEDYEINGKSSGDLRIDEINKIEVKVQNDYKEDMEDVVVTVTILDVDGDDLDEESDEFDLREGKDKKVTIEFDLSREDLDDDTYTIEIKVEGRADDDTEHQVTKEITVDVDIEKHDVVIKKVSLPTNTLECSRQMPFEVTVKNQGKEDEEVDIKVSNSKLNINLEKNEVDLDSFFDRDNDYKAKFNLDLQDVAPGEYTFDVEVFRDGNLDDSKEETITVKSCLTESSTTQKVNLASDSIAQDLLQKALKSGVKDVSEPVTTSFRDTNKYTALLIFLTFMIFIAVVLGLAVLFKK